jgi:phosphatidylethanolamine-binding protein (PEBP) family uncharacterized protein
MILALAIAAALAASGCGGGSDSGVVSTAAPSSKPVTGDSNGTSSHTQGEAQSSGSAPSAAQAPKPDTGKHGPKVPIPASAPEPGLTSEQREEATVASISLTSPALEPVSGSAPPRLPSIYTCDGKDSWPELRWQGVPQGTAELALFAMNLNPVGGKLFFDWAVAGLDPDLEGIEVGRLPRDAVMGRNSFGSIGYSICPTSGGEIYFFALYALSKRLSPGKGFDPHVLREQALQASSDGGLMAASYSRN